MQLTAQLYSTLTHLSLAPLIQNQELEKMKKEAPQRSDFSDGLLVRNIMDLVLTAAATKNYCVLTLTLTDNGNFISFIIGRKATCTKCH